MRVVFECPDHAVSIENIAEGFCREAELEVRAGLAGKPDPRWALVEDDEGEDRWQLPAETAARGAGDCEDIVFAWVGWLRGKDIDRRACLRVRQVGPGKLHAMLKRGDGTLVDVYALHQDAQRRIGVEPSMGGLFSFVRKVGSGIAHGASSVAHGVTSAVSSAAHGVTSTVSSAAHGVESAASSVGHGVASAARSVGHGFEDVGHGIASAARSVGHGVEDAANFVADAPGRLIRGATGLVEDVGNAAIGLGTELVEAPVKLAAGILGKVGDDLEGALGLTPKDQDSGAGADAPPEGDDGYDPNEDFADDDDDWAGTRRRLSPDDEDEQDDGSGYGYDGAGDFADDDIDDDF